MKGLFGLFHTVSEVEIDTKDVASWLAAQDSDVQAAFFNHFADELEAECRANRRANPHGLHFGSAWQMWQIGNGLTEDARYLFGEVMIGAEPDKNPSAGNQGASK